MRENDVPQHGNSTFEGQRKAMYAVNAHGEYTVVPSSGWEAEEMVTTEACAWFAAQADAARARVLRGESSPLEFHMYAQRMDLLTLAQATGYWQWRIRRHLRPQVFEKLSPRVLQHYAEAMGCAPAALKTLP